MTTARFALLLTFAWGVIATGVRHVGPVSRTMAHRPTAGLSDPVALAARILRDADRFTSAAVGPGAIMSTYALAWRVVAQSSAPDSVFRAILATGSRPGKLYALAGLFLTDRATYARSSFYERLQGGQVLTQMGCIVGEQQVTSILDGMDRGEWTREFLTGRPQLVYMAG